jgi:hypothetical protein
MGRLQVRADEVRVGDRCVSRIGKRETLYEVNAPPIPGPYGVVTIRFTVDHRWVLPVQRMVEVERDGESSA